MAFCSRCGNAVEAGSAFCAKCGAPQNAVPAAAPAPRYARPAAPAPDYAQPVPPAPNARGPRNGKLHCPSCKGVQLSPVVETSINGALTSSHGNLSSTRVSNIHRNYWMCNTCGEKFRNIQNLQEEIVYTEKCAKTGIIMTIISTILFLFLILFGEKVALFLFLPFVITVGLFAVVSFFLIFSYKSKAKKLKEELAYLKRFCFN